MTEYVAGTYVKGEDVRVATTPAKAVALVFQGYKLQSEGTDESAAPAAPVTATAPVQDAPSGEPSTEVKAKSKAVAVPTPPKG